MQNGLIGEMHCSRPKLVNGSENRRAFNVIKDTTNFAGFVLLALRLTV